MKAYLKNYRQSPRKVRLVADFIRGKNVSDILVELEFFPKRAGVVITKLIKSAVSNAEHNFKVSSDDLLIKDITVDKGVTFKRVRLRAKGEKKRINKRTSNIALSLGVKK